MISPLGPVATSRTRIGLVLVVATVAQATFGQDLRLFGVSPDLLLLLTICGALAGGPQAGALVGFSAGLLCDLTLATTPIGLFALSWCLVGFVVGTLRVTFFPEMTSLMPLIAFITTVFGVLTFLVVAELVGESSVVGLGGRYLTRVTLVEALWSAVLAIPVQWIYRRAAAGSKGAGLLARPDQLATR